MLASKGAFKIGKLFSHNRQNYLSNDGDGDDEGEGDSSEPDHNPHHCLASPHCRLTEKWSCQTVE